MTDSRWYAMRNDEVAAQLGVDLARGLSTAEVAQRVQRFGRNELVAEKSEPAWRDGKLVELPAEELVPGDIVLFEAGDQVPADGRLIRTAALEIEESALTGESQPAAKQTDPVAGDNVPLGDRAGVEYMNTLVTRGSGEMIVTTTGMETEIGHIATMRIGPMWYVRRK